MKITKMTRWRVFAGVWIQSLFTSATAFFSLFALPGMRRGYQRMAKWIDGIAGTLFAGFGIHLIISR
jgi:threonine efflux protein